MSKKFFLLIISCSILSVNAFDLDLTVDDDIRKNYNSSKLIQDTGISEEEILPALPEISKQEVQNTQINITPAQKKQQSLTSTGESMKVKKGTVFDTINLSQISDWQSKGSTIKFKTKNGIVTKKYAIPSGTIFTGKIVDVHKPQITCNGGLVVIRIQSMTYKGQVIPLNAYVIRANGEKIFFNNMKGDRTYLKTTWKKGCWGRTIFNKMLTLTVNLGNESSTLLLSPFPFAYGTVCLGLNTLTSPICAFFSKGKHLSIPSGSNFKIKLLEDVYIN